MTEIDIADTSQEVTVLDPDGSALDSDVACSADRAEELIDTVVGSANTFIDGMNAILRERAWEPLGYSNPGELVRERIMGRLVNPTTGRPFARSYVFNAIRDVMLRWQLGEELGLDAADIDIPMSVLRALPAGQGGEKDMQVLSKVKDRVAERAADGEVDLAAVQDAVDAVLTEASGKPVGGLKPAGPTMGAPSEFIYDGSGAADAEPGGRDTTDVAEPAPEGDTDNQAPKPRPRPADLAPADEQSMTEVLKELRKYEAWAAVVRQCAEVGELIPPISKINAELPGFIDSCDDVDLAHLAEQVTGAKQALAEAQSAVDTLSTAFAEVTDRRTDAGL